MLAVNVSKVQPRPNGPHGSKCEFSKPHSESLFRVHSPADLVMGEPVNRGPKTSVRWLTVSITCDRSSPSSLIFAIISFVA